MKYPLNLILALGALVLGCSKDTPPPTPPADATAATPVDSTADDSGEASGEDPDAESAEEGDAPASEDGEITADDLPQDAGPITDEYGAVAIAKDPRAEVDKDTKWARIKLEIKTPEGKLFKDPGQVMPFDQLTRVDFDFEGLTHTFLLDLSQDGGKVGVKVTYLAGGEEVVRNYGFDARVDKREVLRLDDGTALAMTIGTKTIKPLPKAEREKLEGAKTRDPLAGTEKAPSPTPKKK